MNYLQPLSNDRRKVSVSDPRRAFRGLPSEPVGLVYGNTTRIDPGLQNVYRQNISSTATKSKGTAQPTIQSLAKYSHHSTTGEDASAKLSEHWAVSQEPVSPRRIATEQRQAVTGETYRVARNYIIAAELAAQRQAAQQQARKAHRHSTRLTAKITKGL